MFCRETVDNLRRLSTSTIGFPDVLLVFPATEAEGRRFFTEAWPEARAVSDSNYQFFRAFDVSKASLRELLGPGVWIRALTAAGRGYLPGWPTGNPSLLPGILLLKEGRVIWKWKFRNIGDAPDFSRLPLLLEEPCARAGT